jgi:hypothetical protein
LKGDQTLVDLASVMSSRQEFTYRSDVHARFRSGGVLVVDVPQRGGPHSLNGQTHVQSPAERCPCPMPRFSEIEAQERP